MKTRRIGIVILVITAIVCGLFVGCSSQTDSAESEKVKIELFSTKTENTQILKSIVSDFMRENPDIEVTLTAEQDASTVLKTRLTKNDIPEVLAIGGDTNYTELQGAAVLLDMSNESFVNDVQDAYLDMVYDVNSDGSRNAYGIPYATNASGVLYNKDLFEAAGVTVPTTWTEFTEVVEQLDEAGIQPFELTYADSWTCLPPWNSMAPVIPSADFTDMRKAGKTAFSGTHEEILEKMLWIMKYGQEDFMGTTYNDGNVAFAQGKAAMMINGNWAITEFQNTNPDMNVDMFAFPATDDISKNTVTSGVDVLLALSSVADDKQIEAGKKLVAFMLRKEIAQKYIDDQFAFSAVNGVKQENPTVASAATAIAEGRVSNFPDHYYPSGYDLAAILQQFALNYTNGMDDAENIDITLASCDEQYDIANVE